ncbi:MAG: HEPN domain-containing protein [Bdellovibrionota bacterium]
MDIETLSKECEILKNALLPNLANANDPARPDYNEDEKKKIAAFCVMSHAELEFFVESLLRKKIEESITAIQNTPSDKVIPNLCFSFGKEKRKPSPFDINQAKEWYLKIIADNHGIKVSNLNSLLEPIGIHVNTLDQNLVSELNSFGADRGKFAHNSFTKVVREIPNPNDLYERVKRIITLLKVFEQTVGALK